MDWVSAVFFGLATLAIAEIVARAVLSEPRAPDVEPYQIRMQRESLERGDTLLSTARGLSDAAMWNALPALNCSGQHFGAFHNARPRPPLTGE